MMTGETKREGVTWLMPVLNGGRYLVETLEALEAELGEGDGLLVWDNGSEDGTLELLAEWIPGRIPGKVFSGRPLGVGGALRELVEAAETEFCARIDADDIPLPGRIARQVAYLREHPEVVLVGGQVETIDEEGRVFGEFHFPEEHEGIVMTFLSGENPIPHPGILFRRAAVLEAGNYREYRNVEDFELWMRLATKWRLANLPVMVTKYRIHAQSTTQAAIKADRLRGLMDEQLLARGPELFGVSREQLAGFHGRRSRFLLPLVLGMRVPTWVEGGGRPYRHPMFLDLLRDRISGWDVVTIGYVAVATGRLRMLGWPVRKLIGWWRERGSVR